MKSRTTNDPTEWMDAPIASAAWKNLLFCKDGRTYLGRQIYASEAEALSIIKSFVPGLPFKSPNGFVLTWDEYSHALPVPWTKASASG